MLGHEYQWPTRKRQQYQHGSGRRPFALTNDGPDGPELHQEPRYRELQRYHRLDGKVAGYNAFVHYLPSPTLENSDLQIGNVRQRTYAASSTRVGKTLVGAFYYSQDGHAACR